MDTIKITKELISVPSYVDNRADESKISQWIFKFLKRNSNLKVTRQYFTKKRFNVVAYNNPKPAVLFVGHTDTVQPKKAWCLDSYTPILDNQKMFGLGSSDMKAGLAILLSGITNYQIKQKAMFVFYGDEEYDFLGMKKFVEEYENKIKPRLVISADGGAREVGNACRGLIELIIRVSGKSGHSADPRSGINAITNSAIVIGNLEKWLKAFSTTELGKSTLNIAYIKGGTNLGKDGLGKEGNIIPDYCEFVVEIRVANPKLNANLVKKFIIQESKKRKLEIVGIKTRHDLGSWITDPKEIRKYIPSQEYRLSDAKKSGYLDIQMLWETFGKVPCFSFGPGNNTAHQENEYVEIKDIMAAQEFYKNLVVKGILK